MAEEERDGGCCVLGKSVRSGKSDVGVLGSRVCCTSIILFRGRYSCLAGGAIGCVRGWLGVV